LTARQPNVLPEDGGNLSYSPHVILIDSSMEIKSLELMCQMSNCAKPKDILKLTFLQQ